MAVKVKDIKTESKLNSVGGLCFDHQVTPFRLKGERAKNLLSFCWVKLIKTILVILIYFYLEN
jgi:hypothetical protein